jgi:hypothetical protein
MNPSQHPHQVRMWGFFIALRSAPLRYGTPLHAGAAPSASFTRMACALTPRG